MRGELQIQKIEIESLVYCTIIIYGMKRVLTLNAGKHEIKI